MGRGELTDGHLVLRPATLDDADLLLSWANEPATRAASLDPDPIDRPTHIAWLTARLATPACRIWIAEMVGAPVGVVRFEPDPDGRAVISMSVDAALRRRGLGGALLAAGVERARAELAPAGFRAWVRPDNAASLRMFVAAGFRPVGGADPAGPVELLQD